MKTCSQCKIEKPFEAFYKNKARPDGLQETCIECIKSRGLELKKNPLMQLEKQIRSSIRLENKLLKRENTGWLVDVAKYGTIVLVILILVRYVVYN